MSTDQMTTVPTVPTTPTAIGVPTQTKLDTNAPETDSTPVTHYESTPLTEQERLALEWQNEQDHYYLDCRDLYEIMN